MTLPELRGRIHLQIFPVNPETVSHFVRHCVVVDRLLTRVSRVPSCCCCCDSGASLIKRFQNYSVFGRFGMWLPLLGNSLRGPVPIGCGRICICRISSILQWCSVLLLLALPFHKMWWELIWCRLLPKFVGFQFFLLCGWLRHWYFVVLDFVLDYWFLVILKIFHFRLVVVTLCLGGASRFLDFLYGALSGQAHLVCDCYSECFVRVLLLFT